MTAPALARIAGLKAAILASRPGHAEALSRRLARFNVVPVVEAALPDDLPRFHARTGFEVLLIERESFASNWLERLERLVAEGERLGFRVLFLSNQQAEIDLARQRLGIRFFPVFRPGRLAALRAALLEAAARNPSMPVGEASPISDALSVEPPPRAPSPPPLLPSNGLRGFFLDADPAGLKLGRHLCLRLGQPVSGLLAGTELVEEIRRGGCDFAVFAVTTPAAPWLLALAETCRALGAKAPRLLGIAESPSDLERLPLLLPFVGAWIAKPLRIASLVPFLASLAPEAK